MPSIVDKKPPMTAEEQRMEEIIKATESCRIASIEHERKVGEDKANQKNSNERKQSARAQIQSDSDSDEDDEDWFSQ